MKILGYNVTKVKNYITKPVDVKKGSFTISTEPAMILPADIQTLKTALLMAKGKYNEYRISLYDMYENSIQFDSILSSLIYQRVFATSGKKLQYTINDQPVESIKTITDSPKFGEFIFDLLNARIFWGMGLFEFYKTKWGNQELFDYSMIPIKHIDPFAKIVRQYQYGSGQDDKSYTDMDNVIFVGGDDDFGLLQTAIVDAIRKRDLMNNWSNYARLAGNNFERIVYKSGELDPVRRASMLNSLQTRDSRTMDFPDDIDYKVENMSSSQQNQLFKEFSGYLDDSLTRLILGQTMTTTDGASLSQAQVHERTQETIFDADGQLLLNILNYDFVEVLPIFGVSNAGKWSFVENAGTKQNDQIEFDLKLKELGYLFTPQQIAQRYGIEETNINTTV